MIADYHAIYLDGYSTIYQLLPAASPRPPRISRRPHRASHAPARRLHPGGTPAAARDRTAARPRDGGTRHAGQRRRRPQRWELASALR